jgi:hypothetical protein
VITLATPIFVVLIIGVCLIAYLLGWRIAVRSEAKFWSEAMIEAISLQPAVDAVKKRERQALQEQRRKTLDDPRDTDEDCALSIPGRYSERSSY